MKIFNKIMMFLTIAIFIGACDEDDLTVLNPNATTSVSLSTSDVVLEKSNEGLDALTVKWTEPDYGFSAAANYNILFDLVGGNFEKPQVVSGGSEMIDGEYFKTFKTEQLNKILLNLGAEPGTAAQLDVKVNAVLSNTNSLASDVSSTMATAYADVLDLSTIWGIVGSAAPNGWNGPDVPFYKTDEANVYAAYVTLIEGLIKFRQNNSWDDPNINYGSNNADGTLQVGGSDIPVIAGTYKVTFNVSELTYTIEEYAWGIVGSATPNEWGGPDMPLSYDSYSDTWKGVVVLIEGVIKFRQNNSWDAPNINYGSNNADGNLQNGGSDIPVTSGTYEVIVNFNDLTYSIEETDIWGVVGSASPNKWDGPDLDLARDYSKDGVYYVNGAILTDGVIKFRTNGVWGNDYGDKAPLDGILDKEDGNDIPVTAGTYDIILNFSNPDVPTYTITVN